MRVSGCGFLVSEDRFLDPDFLLNRLLMRFSSFPGFFAGYNAFTLPSSGWVEKAKVVFSFYVADF